MTILTGARIPEPMLADARERWPETRDMPPGRVLRYALAIALGKSQTEALAATKDPRKGVSRKIET